VTRTARVYVPADLPVGGRTPVVITLHGAQLTADYQAGFDGVDQLADTQAFISVHPQGGIVDLFGAPELGWDVYNPNSADPPFIATLIDDLIANDCVDPHRVYLIGFSNGGGMAQLVSCTLGGKIAAVASVEAIAALPCPDAPGVAFVAFHGLQDQFYPYNTGTAGLPPVPTTLQTMADRNQCDDQPPTVLHLNADVDILRWHDCHQPTQLYRINHQGHSWPGHPYGPTEAQWEAILTATGAPTGTLTIQQAATTLALTNPTIDATTTAWHFFQRTAHDVSENDDDTTSLAA
jgi:polyhydroxybutyrate depolymerase